MEPRTLTLRATAIALELERRAPDGDADVTDIQRLLVWYYGSSTRPERRGGERRRHA
ncbi:MAG TPA: hypothetical protein VMU66_01375 [Gaiellales bacterium]|nr:hypothetical protein [Gaiellales bacterium]